MLVAFVAYLGGVFLLSWSAHRFLRGGSFIKEYFLGSRRLGPWVLAISFGATAISGGSFVGFPSLIYSKGWVMALWIASYMIVPLVTMVILGKRINQASRLSGAVTIPDLLRDRYDSPAIALVTSLILIIFLGVNLVAQFKAGGFLMLEAWREPFESLKLIPVREAIGAAGADDRGYILGLVIFAAMVIAYTVYGGFWGVSLTDVFQGLVMVGGVLILAVLAWRRAGGLESASSALLEQDPALVYGPGPAGYLPFGLAVSFFFQWTIIGIGQPGQMVRLMSFRDTRSLKRALSVCAVYYAIIYTSLVVIFICARALYPSLAVVGIQPDQIMPYMVRQLASPVLAGFLIAAPYAAIMSTVAAYLLVISSSLVRDLYQRFVDPDTSSPTMRRLSYATTIVVGAAAFLGALNPPEYLQYIIVFSTAGLGVALLAPVALGLFWPGATRAGALWGMIGGVLCHLSLYAIGWTVPGARMSGADSQFLPWCPLGLDPLLWSLAASFALGIGVSRLTRRPEAATIRRYFFTEGDSIAAPAGRE